MQINTIVPLRSDWHVVPSGVLWKLRQEHRADHWGLYLTKQEAIGAGIGQARLSATSLIIHGRDGRIQRVHSYDNVTIPYDTFHGAALVRPR